MELLQETLSGRFSSLLLLVAAVCSPAAAADDVLVFTDSNFQLEISRYPVILVKFYAPWCGHCKQLAPEYEKAASILKRADPSVPLAKVDCTVETDTCSRYGVSGYPTLKIFKNGEYSKDYDAERETDAIVKKMNREAGPVSKKLETVEDAQRFINKDSIGVIGFFESENNNEAKAFLKVADHYSFIRFAHTTSEDIKEEVNMTKQGVILYRPKIMQNPFEESEVRTTETGTVKLKNFLETEGLGLCGERTQANAEYFKYPIIVAYYNVDYARNAKGSNYWRNRVMKVGKKLKDEGARIYFAISHVDEMSRELDECGIEDRGGDKPVVCAWQGKFQKFRMDDSFSVESFEHFVRGFLAGKIEPYVKSEPVPVSNDEPVKVVVAKNFDDIVNDETKDVLIEFYAPWCGHCKSLAPKYEEVARKLQKEQDIIIAKMDATANDVSSPYEVSGFPTIYFAAKDRKSSPKIYDGEREVDDIIKFLAREATDPLSGYDRDGNKKSKKKKKVENIEL
ncbi:unnamed protein product [Candidula unifasciata]|uniref:Protein disulfide-isomerase n=1 Tax=Candidula unifasciata TaxID=100452 RepID=A0A8S3ZKX5_9EUPU|nr:unnamed protein product [Candidula unifasciata]